MKLLLDTHILLWWLLDSDLLSQAARDYIGNTENSIYYSMISILEIELKFLAHPGKIDFSGEQVLGYCNDAGFGRMDLTAKHILGLASLHRPEEAPPHKDPFDRLMLCQAKVEGMMFLTHDHLIPDYHESCVLYV